MARNRKNKAFVRIPHYLMDTEAYQSLNGNAIKLLNCVVYQYRGNNNGDLLITHSFLEKYFKYSQAMYRARDELLKKGFIAINAYGGRSYGGRKLPTLYAITWESVNDFRNLEKNTDRYTHLPIDKKPLNYFIEGVNPNYKNTKQKKAQFKKDIKRANVKR